jgi:hypothetical protein
LSTSIDLSLNYSLQKHGDLFPKAPTTSGRSVLASANLFLYSYSVVVEAMLRMVWGLGGQSEAADDFSGEKEYKPD